MKQFKFCAVIILLLIILTIPSVTSAARWNPLSWNWNPLTWNWNIFNIFLKPQPNTVQQNPTAGWQTYINEKYGYQINYPVGWITDVNLLSGNISNKGDAVFCPPELQDRNSVNNGIECKVGKTNGGSINPQAPIALFQCATQGSALETCQGYKDRGNNLGTDQTGKYFYILYLGDNGYQTIYNQILSTFKFTNQKQAQGNEQNKSSSLDDAAATTDGVSAVVGANNQFASDFYAKHESDSNFFFSPYSISSALSMVYEGAKGDTATQIANVFHLPDVKVLEPSSAKIYNEINKADKSYSLNTANALWAQKSYTFLSGYFQKINKYYGGNLTNLDFINNTENSRITINNWVEDQTNHKIKDLIPQGAIGASTRLVLTNAIYFKGKWDKQFDKKNTTKQDFNVAPGNTVKADMMQLTGEDARFKYTENDDVQVLNLPYQGNDLSMTLILPKSGKTIQDAEKYLAPQKFSDLKTGLQNQQVNIYIPKFKLETKYFMKDDLSGMGMPVAFSDSADFSGMTGSTDLKISQVIHQAFVEVDEEGTEAAAATGVGMTTSMSPEYIKIFRADHPFLFFIQQDLTGNILFLGRLNNPAQ